MTVGPAVHQLVYVSSATSALEDHDLLALLHVSQERNQATGVTGLLLFCEGNFIQLLEGDRAAVRTTYERLRADSRHHQVHRVLEHDVERRSFGDWAMGFRHLGSEDLGGLGGVSNFLRERGTAGDDAGDPSVVLQLLQSFRDQMT